MADKVEVCASYSLHMLHEQLQTLIAQQEAEGWRVRTATTTCLERTYGQQKRQLYYTTTVLFKKVKE